LRSRRRGVPWIEIEARIEANYRKWSTAYSGATIRRCSNRRLALLARAAELPMGSNADAATALRVVMKTPGRRRSGGGDRGDLSRGGRGPGEGAR
jgi:hypothetical protein